MASDLQRYVSNGKITKLKNFLDTGTVDVNDRLPNGWTALHRATEENKIKMMKVLLDYNSNIEAKTDAGFTPLMVAVQSGNLEGIKLLVAHKADVNAQNGYAATPLMLAAADGRLAIIQYLLKQGADPEIHDYRKQTAADWAEERGNHEIISYFTKFAQDQQGHLSKTDIEKVMKEQEGITGGIGKKRASNLGTHVSTTLHIADNDPELLTPIQSGNSMKSRPSNVSMFSVQSAYGETDFLNMHSTMVSLQDRLAELELRIKKQNDVESRLERVESRLGINEMLKLIERNRILEEKIRKMETKAATEKAAAEKLKI